MKKVTELINDKDQFSYSFEVTPDILDEDIKRVPVEPKFYSVTWHAKNHRCKSLDIDALKTACSLEKLNKNVLLHLTCDLMTKEYLNRLLLHLQEKDICNLFVVLGENYDPAASEFKNTTELIKYIRQKTGQYFCIGVAAFPNCSEVKLAQTKEKFDCGADFMITQAFFDANEYAQFKMRCETAGINVPIIPGIFAFESQKQLHRFVNLCKIKVSDELLRHVENSEKLKVPCTKITKHLIQDIMFKCQVKHFHFFTLNKLENVGNILMQIE